MSLLCRKGIPTCLYRYLLCLSTDFDWVLEITGFSRKNQNGGWAGRIVSCLWEAIQGFNHIDGILSLPTSLATGEAGTWSGKKKIGQKQDGHVGITLPQAWFSTFEAYLCRTKIVWGYESSGYYCSYSYATWRVPCRSWILFLLYCLATIPLTYAVNTRLLLCNGTSAISV